jgi:hypothetical protein
MYAKNFAIRPFCKEIQGALLAAGYGMEEPVAATICPLFVFCK